MAINSGVINGFTINGAGVAAPSTPPAAVVLIAVSSIVTNIIATLAAPGLAAIALPMATAQINLKQQTESTCSIKVPTWDQAAAIEARRVNGVITLTATFSRDGVEYDSYEIGAFDVSRVTQKIDGGSADISLSASRSLTFATPKTVQFDQWTTYNLDPGGVQIEAASVDFTLAPLDTATSFGNVDAVIIDEVNFNLSPALARMSMTQNFAEPVISA